MSNLREQRLIMRALIRSQNDKYYNFKGFHRSTLLPCYGFVHRSMILLFADLENRQECLLGNVDFADPLHALFAFFLFLQQFALSADVSAVTLGDDVFADGGNSLPGDDLRADGSLNRHLEHLPWNQFAHLRDESAATVVSEVAVHDDGERVDG